MSDYREFEDPPVDGSWIDLGTVFAWMVCDVIDRVLSLWRPLKRN